MSTVAEAVRSSTIMTKRNLLHIWREPGALISSILTSITFVVLFAFVIGGGLGGLAYPEFLIPGMLGQNAAFAIIYTTVGLAYDMDKGIVDRFRSMPINRVAVVLGRCASDMTSAVVNLTILSLCGLLIGWGIHAGFARAALAYLLLLLFAFAMAWMGAYLGLLCKRVEVAQGVGTIWVFPFTFISSALVSTEFMFPPFKQLAEWNPLTALCNSIRMLFGNAEPPGYPVATGWPAEHAVLYCVISCVAMLAIFIPLTARKYQQLSRR